MEPHGRDKHQENILEGFIHGDEVIVGDVTKTFLNDSGEGDESLNRGDGSGEVEADARDGGERREGEAGEGERREGERREGEAGEGTLNIKNSGEVYIYYLIKIQLSIYIY